MKFIITVALLLLLFYSFAQSSQNIETLAAPANNENINNIKLFSDSLVSSSVLFIKKEVKLHKHAFHSEHVYVVDGEADMILGDKNIHLKKGEMIFIPKNTPHSVKVTSAVALKVISIQAPLFDGKDRVVLE